MLQRYHRSRDLFSDNVTSIPLNLLLYILEILPSQQYISLHRKPLYAIRNKKYSSLLFTVLQTRSETNLSHFLLDFEFPTQIARRFRLLCGSIKNVKLHLGNKKQINYYKVCNI